jgi:hypothetical protein
MVNGIQTAGYYVMFRIPLHIEFIARVCLSFLWLFTAATSYWWGRSIGYEILAQQNIHGDLASWCINLGSVVDAVIGFWLLIGRQLGWCYKFQMILILTYSVLISFIAPQLWLHPFGPITKNIPIIALIFILMKSEAY